MDREFWMRAGMQFKFEYIPDQIFANFRFCKGTKSYEEIPLFYIEWLNILNTLEDTQSNGNHFREKINDAKKRTSEQYYYSLMVQQAHKGKPIHALGNFIKGISVDCKTIFKLGTWKLFFRVFFIDSSKISTYNH